MRTSKQNKAFTVVEVLAAILLVGIAIASLLVANSSFTKANSIGAELSTAEFLIEQIRELTTLLPVVDPETDDSFGAEEGSLANYDDIDDFDGQTFSPPIDAGREVLNNFAAYSQQVTVENVSTSNFEQAVADNSTDFVRITVQVSLNSRPISSASWIRARY